VAAREASTGVVRQGLPMTTMSRLRRLPPVIAMALLVLELDHCSSGVLDTLGGPLGL
jgi:hypothetical protein